MTESDLPEPEPVPTIDEVLAEDSDKAVEASVENEEAKGGRPLALDSNAANALAALRRPTVLVLAGAVGSGKTSVYAALYERLGRGSFAGWIFAGSRTIPGLEQRCHWWRTSSGGTEPYMEHTRADDLPWLHIRLRDAERNSPPQDLLMGDFDGEFFEDFLAGRRPPSDLPYLRRADHVGLVINGDKMADATLRAAEKQQARYLLDALLQPEALASADALSIVVTKTDKIETLGLDTQSEIETSLEEINAEASKSAGVSVPLFRLAVRSRTSLFPLGHGLEPLFEKLSLQRALQIGEEAERYEPKAWLGRFEA